MEFNYKIWIMIMKTNKTVSMPCPLFISLCRVIVQNEVAEKGDRVTGVVGRAGQENQSCAGMIR